MVDEGTRLGALNVRGCTTLHLQSVCRCVSVRERVCVCVYAESYFASLRDVGEEQRGRKSGETNDLCCFIRRS